SCDGDWHRELRAWRRNATVQPTMLAGGGRLCRGFADDQLGLDGNLRGIVSVALDSFEQSLGCDLAHSIQRLAHGRETRSVESCTRDIVKTENRNILRHPKPLLMNRLNCPNTCHVVVRKNACEWL